MFAKVAQISMRTMMKINTKNKHHLIEKL